MTAPALARRLLARRRAPRPQPPPSLHLRTLVEYAARAPSSHNTQPWRFRAHAGGLDLLGDPVRRLPVRDPHGRELTISCGAALQHLRVAMHRFGHTGTIESLPDPRREPDLMARVTFGEAVEASQRDVRYFHAISMRRTNRRPFEPRAVPDPVLDAIADAARSEGAWARVVTDAAEKDALAELVAEGDRRQAADPAFRREYAAWMHPNHSRARDGLPGYALALGELESLAAPFLVRRLDWGNGRAERDRGLALGSPALLVLGTAADEPFFWLRAGQALGRLLLEACTHWVSASFFNQPIEVEWLRPRVTETLGVRGHAQMILRLGYGPDVAPTPRRPVGELFTE